MFYINYYKGDLMDHLTNCKSLADKRFMSVMMRQTHVKLMVNTTSVFGQVQQ